MSCVSVIIPTYNHARFVKQAVMCALAQTYPNVEVIVVDDGSSDNTQSVLAPYSSRIRLLYQPNQGVAMARNAGFAVAHGDYVLFLDADDLIPPEKLAIQVAHLQSCPDAGLVYSAFQRVSERGKEILFEVRPGVVEDPMTALLRRKLYFPPGVALLRRDCLERVGGFDPSCAAAADTELWLRIAKAGYAFAYVDAPLFYYRLVRDSMSSRLAVQARDEIARLDKFFSDTTLPLKIKELAPEAYALINYEFAAKYYNVGEIDQGRVYLRKATLICETLASDAEWLLEWLAGFALSPDVSAPHQFLDRVFDHLPSEAKTLRMLRRQAHARYHAAAAFTAYQNHQLQCIRKHVWPALLADPWLVRNRGFVSIALQSFFVR